MTAQMSVEDALLQLEARHRLSLLLPSGTDVGPQVENERAAY